MKLDNFTFELGGKSSDKAKVQARLRLMFQHEDEPKYFSAITVDTFGPALKDTQFGAIEAEARQTAIKLLQAALAELTENSITDLEAR
jgi:hypothetical protein